ncbi:GNAT family N-acetyltransferase [soil metagenome]
MRNPAFRLREMHPGDIAGAMKLSTAEGWNQTERDWKFLIKNPKNICLLAECSGKVIGTTTAINYSSQIAWIGMVLVDKQYRGKGVSRSLLTNVLEKTAAFKSVKLDATSAGQQVYKKFGFEEEFQIARMINLSAPDLSIPIDVEILPECIEPNLLTEITDFDENIFGVNRSPLIEYLLSEYPQKAWMIKRNNSIAGIALGRIGNKYHHIGPVSASNINDAKSLIATALRELKDQSVVVDVLADKENLMTWLSSIGFIKQREFVRMYKEENTFPGIIKNEYLICGPEFG